MKIRLSLTFDRTESEYRKYIKTKKKLMFGYLIFNHTIEQEPAAGLNNLLTATRE